MEVKKVKLGQEEKESVYWKDKSHVERLNMVERLRSQFVTGAKSKKVYEIRKTRIR